MDVLCWTNFPASVSASAENPLDFESGALAIGITIPSLHSPRNCDPNTIRANPTTRPQHTNLYLFAAAREPELSVRLVPPKWVGRSVFCFFCGETENRKLSTFARAHFRRFVPLYFRRTSKIPIRRE